MERACCSMSSRRKTAIYLKVFVLITLLLTPCTILLMQRINNNMNTAYDISQDLPPHRFKSSVDILFRGVDKSVDKLSKRIERLKRQRYKYVSSDKIRIKMDRNLDKPVQQLVKSERIKGKFVQNEVYEIRCLKTVKLLILVLSKGRNKQRREYIRKTWGRFSPLKTDQGKVQMNWKLLFIVGSATEEGVTTLVHNEGQQKRDLLQFNIMEFPLFQSWTIMAALEWIDTCCLYEYVLLMQDSLFLNTPALYSFIHDASKPSKSLYAGVIAFDKKVPREGRYSLKVKNYPKDVYPRHANGGAFIMSSDAVSQTVSKFSWSNTLPDSDATIGQFVLQAGIDVWSLDTLIANVTKEQCLYRYNTILTEHNDNDDCKNYLYNHALKQIVSL